ncbi:MAG: heat-inducible transcriptional repressor HrcA [Anaerolineaceae bacterium]
MSDLSERQKLILTLVIHEYARTAIPVGSKNLVEDYRLEISSATVRSEMSALTEMGYLRQPHTSAGREPTEEAYRYFVRNLLHQTELPDSTRSMISHQFYQSRQDVEQWMRLAASILAKHTRAASLVTAPHPEQVLLKHVELISTRGRQVLMILVMLGGEIHQRVITLDEPVSQEQLSETSRRLTQTIQGKDIASVKAAQSQFGGLDQDVMRFIIKEMESIDSLAAGEVYLDGLTNMLEEPGFTNSLEARRAIRMLEEKSQIQELLQQALAADTVGGVQVLIGGEGSWDELRQCAIVLSRYGMPGLVTGMLGVVGPMRLQYGRTISTVRFLSGLLSDLVAETIME